MQKVEYGYCTECHKKVILKNAQYIGDNGKGKIVFRGECLECGDISYGTKEKEELK